MIKSEWANNEYGDGIINQKPPNEEMLRPRWFHWRILPNREWTIKPFIHKNLLKSTNIHKNYLLFNLLSLLSSSTKICGWTINVH